MVAEAWLSSQIFSFSTLYAWPNSLSLSLSLSLSPSLCLTMQRYISPSLNPFFWVFMYLFSVFWLGLTVNMEQTMDHICVVCIFFFLLLYLWIAVFFPSFSIPVSQVCSLVLHAFAVCFKRFGFFFFFFFWENHKTVFQKIKSKPYVTQIPK